MIVPINTYLGFYGKERFFSNSSPSPSDIEPYSFLCNEIDTKYILIIFLLINLPISLFLAYRTFCRIPYQYIFLIVYLLILIIPVYEIIVISVLSKEKCNKLKNPSGLYSTLKLISESIGYIVGLLMLYFGFVSLFMTMEPVNCIRMFSNNRNTNQLNNYKFNNKLNGNRLNGNKSNGNKSNGNRLN